MSPALRTKAAAGEPLRVLLFLRTQPQRATLERLEAAAGLRRQVAEGEYRRALAGGEPLGQARAALDDVVLTVRRAAAAEIAQRIGSEQTVVSQRLEALGGQGIRRFTAVNVIAAVLPPAALAALESDDAIAEIAEEGGGQAALNVSVPSLGAPTLWNTGHRGEGESVAILDTGVKTNHPFFTGITFVEQVFLNSGRTFTCFADDASSPQDQVGHGTHIAGIIASRGAIGAADYLGVGPGISTIYNLKIMFKCSDPGFPSGRYLDTDVIAALDWLVANTPVKVVNFSAGDDARVDDSTLTKVFDNLADTYGLFISVCAGNNGPTASSVWAPGVGYNILSVGNVDDRGTLGREDDILHGSSSRGPTRNARQKPDIAAPGTNIQSANAGLAPLLAGYTGTSMSAPHMAGSAALLRQMGVLDALSAKALLINSSDTAGWRPAWGWGYANLAGVPQQTTFTDSVGAGASSVLFRGSPPGALRATVTWRRHVTGSSSVFTPMSLSLYSRAGGAMLASSDDPKQNVQQVSATTSSDVVLSVSGSNAEKFGLAVSDQSFVKASGPSLGIACTPPPAAFPNVSISVSCTVSNSGDLEAFAASAVLSPPGSNQALGTIHPGGVVPITWGLTTAGAEETRTYQVAVSGTSYGQAYSGAATFAVHAVAPPAPGVVTTVSAATFAPGAPLAAETIVTGFGQGLAAATEAAPPNPPLPTSLAGTMVKVKDSAGTERLSPLWFVSPGQINYYISEGTATGAATVTVSNQDQVVAAGTLQIEAVAPGLFAMNANGQGVAAAVAVWAKPDNSQTWGYVFAPPCIPGSCVPTPLDLGPETDRLYLQLYGTGIRGRSSLSAVSARIGGVDAPVEYAGPVAGLTGLDQVNLRVPRSLAGRGEVDIVLTVDGKTANTVQVDFR